MKLSVCNLLVLVLSVLAVQVPVYWLSFVPVTNFSSYGKGDIWHNWGGVSSCSPVSFSQPQVMMELVSLVKNISSLRQTIKVVGSGYGWGNIFCSSVNNTHLINLDKYNRVLKLDTQERLITVQAGATYDDIIDKLSQNGLRLPLWPSYSTHTIGGVLSKGLYSGSSGNDNSNSANNLIDSVSIITGDGNIVSASATYNTDVFNAVRTGVGVIGIISTVTLRCVPDTQLTSYVTLTNTNITKIIMKYHQIYDYCTCYIFSFASGRILCEGISANPEVSDSDSEFDIKAIFSRIIIGLYHRIHYLFPFHMKSVFCDLILVGAQSINSYSNNYFSNFVNFVLQPGTYSQTSSLGSKMLVPFNRPRASTTSFIEIIILFNNNNNKAVISCIESIYSTIIVNQGKDGFYWRGTITIKPFKGGNCTQDNCIWLSPFYSSPTQALHSNGVVISISQGHSIGLSDNKKVFEKVILGVLESSKCSFAYPSWSSQHLYTLSQNKQSQQILRKIFTHWDDFERVRQKYDPNNIFLSEFWENILNNKN